MNKKKILAFLSVFMLGVLALIVNPDPAQAQSTPSIKRADSELGSERIKGDIFVDETKRIATLYGEANDPRSEVGAWETVPLPDNPEDWMQAVHASLLPNGKVLIVNGSSNRNTLVKDGDKVEFSDGVNSTDYEVVNNTSLFDPETGNYERIDSPPAVANGQSNDPFCSGQCSYWHRYEYFQKGTEEKTNEPNQWEYLLPEQRDF